MRLRCANSCRAALTGVRDGALWLTGPLPDPSD